MSDDDQDGYAGQQGYTDPTNEHNERDFHIDTATKKQRTTTYVKVIAVHGGGVGEPGTMDVLPLINQVDALGKPSKHGTVFKIPYTRNQSGTNAIISDPQKDDIGIVSVSDRDSSSVRATKDQANPGSKRHHSMADAIWHGTVLGKAPIQYINWLEDGVEIVTKSGATFRIVNGDVQIIPKPGAGIVYVGGTGTDGVYDWVMTASGPSNKAKARIS